MYNIVRACNGINRCTKTLGLTCAYIQKCLIGGKDIADFLYSDGEIADGGRYGMEEARTIDIVAKEYALSLGAEWSMEEWQKSHEIPLRKKWCLLCCEGEDWEESEVRSDQGKKYSRRTLNAAVEMIRKDIASLYGIKTRVLSVARENGMLRFGRPERIGDDWIYSCSWDGVPFHFPASSEDSILFEIQYKGIPCRYDYTVKQKKHSAFTRMEILKDVWILIDFLAENEE